MEHPSLPAHQISNEALSQLHQLHVINLDRSRRRWETFQSQNHHIKDVVRVPAIDGATINRQDYIDSGEITEDLAYGQGTLGSAMSHIGLWKRAVSQNRLMTIVEDDVFIARDFEAQTIRMLATLPPDWDLILWGYNANPTYTWVDFGFSKAELRFYGSRISTDPESFHTLNCSPNAVRIAHAFGLQAYSVSPKGANILIEYCRPLRDQLIPFPGTNIVVKDTSLDCAMNGVYDKMQAFLSLPPLVIPIPGEESERGAADA